MVKIITLEQYGQSGIISFDRVDNRRTSKIINDFKPYFYIQDDKGEFKSLFGKNYKKIFTQSSKDVAFEREKYQDVCETHIKYVDRYSIDCISIPIPKRNLRKCFIDIENVDCLDTENTPEPITTITCYDNYLNKYVTFCYKPSINNKEEKNQENSIYYFDDEKKMITKFILFILDIQPDIITGFNVNFDLSYIVNRAKKLKLDINKISPMNFIKIDKFGVKIYGLVVLDMKKLCLHNFVKKELFQNDLNHVAEYLIGKKKLEVEETPGELWRTNLDLLIKYNIEDVKLLVEIDEKMGVIDFYDTLRREIGCGWNRITSVSYLHDIETYRKARELNVIIPKIDLKEFKSVEGADVEVMKTGLFSNTIYLDIVQQYPYAIMLCNISPETIDNFGEIMLDLHLRFKKNNKGIIPQIVEGEIKYRDEAKRLMYEELKLNGKTEKYYSLNKVQYAMKALSASWYPMFNTEYYCLKDRRLTEAITTFSRKSISWAKNIVEKNGYDVIGFDTDGMFIDSKLYSKEETIQLGLKIQNLVNESYKDFLKELGVDSGELQIKFEGLFKSFFMGSKKHYFGNLIYQEGQEVDEMVVKGYEVVRVDTSKVCRNMMNDVFKMILEGRKKDDIDNYVSLLKKDLQSGKYTIFDIGIPKPYKEDLKVKTAQFKAVQFSNNYLNTTFKHSDRVLYIYGKIQGMPITEAFAFKDNKFFKQLFKDKKVIIDWKRMMPVLIDNKINRLYEAIGWEGKKSKSLMEY